MRNSNPRVSSVSVQRPNSNLDSMFTMQATGRNFQHGSNVRVSILLVVMNLLPLEECIHDRSLYEIVSNLQLSLVMKYCPFQQHSEILHPYKNFLNLSCCDNFFNSFSILLQWEILIRWGHHNPKKLVLIALNTIDCPISISSRPDLS